MSERMRKWALLMLHVVLAGAVFGSEDISKAPLADVLILSNGMIRAEVMLPNSPDRYNRGTRFTNVATVLRVSVEEDEFLFAPVEHNPMTESGGLAAEFNKDDPTEFQNAIIGEGFLKIGVGVLRKDSEHYDFYRPYEVIERAKTEYRAEKDRVDFIQVSPEFRGYRYRLTASVELEENRIILRNKLENLGERALEVQHYVHNFFSLNGVPIGEAYRLDLGRSASGGEVLRGNARIEGEQIRFPEKVEESVVINVPSPIPLPTEGEILLALGDDLSVRVVTEGVPLVRTFIYAREEYVSPEQFVEFPVEPGEAIDWIRTYHFNRESVPE
ncbi:hypothetical protein [Puniceicoccus vermicola]|uniref:Uncharacterized protein n=1 Tax=Puniceicoccus vermicola TaxID=388746 RepID=A0A7X1AUP0_9BACT|nr:hypothetical protein [Puniceicoccus vermicola]MBC2600194.1 hypothetical protein [Puniceicoccus vermicola]